MDTATAVRGHHVQGNTRALAVVTAIFFMWGFLTCLNDILIPHLKAAFALTWVQAMLIQFTFFGAYFLMSLPAGRLVAAVGYKRGIVAGLAIAGAGALLFWPAAAVHAYGLFLAALFVLATGITVLQVAANPYVALLGDERTSSSRLTLAQSMNSLGTTLAPLFGGLLILSAEPRSEAQLALLPQAEALAYRAAEAQSVQLPYFGLAVALFLLALAIRMFRLPAIPGVEGGGHPQGRLRDALRHRHVRLGVLAIFFYVGAEVSIGSVLVNFLSSPGIGHGMSEQEATGYVSLYWGGALVGRLLGAVLLARMDARRLLGLFALAVVVLLQESMSMQSAQKVRAIVLALSAVALAWLLQCGRSLWWSWAWTAGMVLYAGDVARRRVPEVPRLGRLAVIALGRMCRYMMRASIIPRARAART